ncbi:hypothetical protein ACIRYZ_23620 [Kitasatospora sp. NPDC101155]|uniref:hypothetical protein n=1 Tax=Kitasatospora sp. NPDC101155 TaxID=3364097 RepID=UPI00380792C5
MRQMYAHMYRLGGQEARAADLYRELALDLLDWRGDGDPETEEAVSNADACWRAVTDAVAARAMAPAVLALRVKVPGPQGRWLVAARRHAERLDELPESVRPALSAGLAEPATAERPPARPRASRRQLVTVPRRPASRPAPDTGNSLAKQPGYDAIGSGR